MTFGAAERSQLRWNFTTGRNSKSRILLWMLGRKAQREILTYACDINLEAKASRERFPRWPES